MSEIKVNKLTPRTACGTTTLGDSGDTFNIPAGVTITNSGTAAGFGSTGEVSWNTTKITADPGPAVSGVGYFTDTSGAAFNVTLPLSPSAGAVIAVADYANTWDDNNLTLLRNGSNIEGAAENYVANIEGASITLVYVDVTKGWIVTNAGNSTSGRIEPVFIVACGGNSTTTIGDYKVHAFTAPGTFTVSCAGNSVGSNTVETMIVAGGGGAGFDRAGGAGAGGMVLTPTCGVSVTATGYPITVGGGGAGIASPLGGGAHVGANGVNSTGFCLTAIGGGGTSRGGNGRPLAEVTGEPGGSGGGGGGGCGTVGPGGPATQPTQPGNSGTYGNGFAGGNASPAMETGGGGGAGAVGVNAVASTTSGPGGAGIDVSPRFGTAPQPFYIADNANNGPTATGIFAGGGGGGASGSAPPTSGGTGGPGGGGFGGNSPITPANASGKDGLDNTGGGGGGSSNISPTPYTGGSGGSGIVLIRYKFQ